MKLSGPHDKLYLTVPTLVFIITYHAYKNELNWLNHNSALKYPHLIMLPSWYSVNERHLFAQGNKGPSPVPGPSTEKADKKPKVLSSR